DNQLSEYSSFPELIKYKNRGFKSCALVPVAIGGRVIAIVEMLSFLENKFVKEIVDTASLGAYFASMILLSKYESERGLKLAGYFNAAFNSSDIQLLISSDGKILKANDNARKELAPRNLDESSIGALIGMEFPSLVALSRKGATSIPLTTSRGSRLYRLVVNALNERMLHLSLDDITELDMLSRITENMDTESYAGAIYLDKALVVTGATDSIERAIGYDKNLIVGKEIIELTVERQRGELKELLEKRDSEARLHGVISLASESGVPANLRFTLSKWAGGYVMLFSDARAESYIDGIRNAFTDFINSTSDMVITMDASGYIKDCNMPTESVLGYPKSMLLGKEMRSLYADQTAFDKNIAYARNGGKVDNSYAVLLDKDGKQIDSTHSIRLFRSPDSIDYIMVIKELETKRKLADLQDRLDKEDSMINKLKSTGDLKSQFIYNISHELKTPLTNIIGFSKLLYKGEFGELNTDQLNYIKTIIDEADRLIQMIQQVLDAAKLESEKMKLEVREVNLKELYNNPTMQSMRESALKEGLKFSWNVEYDVPTIIADPNRLIQVFVNLIGNSIKFTDKGDIKVKIANKGKSFVECSVTDTGIGISDEDRHKLFRKFYEAPTKRGLVKQEGAGTGLGLSITKQIVELHGGKISCESEPGKGSTFSFTLRVKGVKKRK
ncbi:TPA: PAS domain-containing sensor histidine kinase, partial [Candidatus Micrarchaeota archaeon]|nr:PAS domain-containing sensor histidine kinase [Candidatus Micrarchaeota archaeon]